MYFFDFTVNIFQLLEISALCHTDGTFVHKYKSAIVLNLIWYQLFKSHARVKQKEGNYVNYISCQQRQPWKSQQSQ